MKRGPALVVALCTALAAPSAAAARVRLTDVPCAGCVTSWSEGDDAPPMLVVLHGDYGQDAASLHRAWEPAVAARKITLVSLACPASESCQGSWWRWNGSPAWIAAQVDRVAERRGVDRARVWIAGWSGGASYIGLRTQEIERTFAAIVIHGGGIPPQSSDCGEDASAIRFLVGTKNPLHGLAVRLRQHYERCRREVVWNAIDGADHPQEWKALAANAPEIVGWLEGKRKPIGGATPGSSATTTSSTASTTATTTTTTSTTTATAAPTTSANHDGAALALPPRSGCGCSACGSAMGGPASLLVLLAWCARRRRAALIALAACTRSASTTPPTPASTSSTSTGTPSTSTATAGSSAIATTLANDSPPAALACLIRHYGGRVEKRDGAFYLVLASGVSIAYGDGRPRSLEERLARPDVESMFADRYAAGPIAPVTRVDFDPGRVRIEPLFEATYGATAREVEAALVNVTLRGQTIRVHRRVAPALRRVAERLDRAASAAPSLDRFLKPLGGTFNPRKIAGTDRTSAHAWGIAIDLNPALAEYWRNDAKLAWTNRVPQEIVDAFEAEGFVWGGRWYHYDTMHFEYRPELLDPSCYG